MAAVCGAEDWRIEREAGRIGLDEGALDRPLDTLSGEMCIRDRYISEHSLATKVAVIYNNADTYSTGIYQTLSLIHI